MTVRICIAEFFLHLGWAVHGQQCGCGSSPFNGLAKRMDFGDAGWDTENPEPVALWAKAQYHIGVALIGLHGRLMARA